MVPFCDLELDFKDFPKESPIKFEDFVNKPEKDQYSWLEALKFVRPEWFKNTDTEVQFDDLSTGYCNRNVRFNTVKNQDDVIILRQFNAVVVSRWSSDVTRNYAFAHKHGLGPKQVATFQNGICVLFEHGETVSWESRRKLLEEDFIEPIASEIARYHVKKLAREASDFGVAADFFFMREDIVRESWKTALDHHGPIFEKTAPSIDEFLANWTELNEITDKFISEKRLCHYDMNPTNFVQKSDGKMILVDIDQLVLGYPMCDIDWFFLCLTGLLNPDFSTYPSEDYIHIFLRAYLLARKRHENESETVEECEIDHLRTDLEMAHLVMLMRMLSCAVVLSSGFSENAESTLPSGIQRCWQRYQTLKETTIEKVRKRGTCPLKCPCN